MSARSDAYRLIAYLVGCSPEKLPGLEPVQFAYGDWLHFGEYGGTQDIRECMMGVWKKMGVNTVCPICGRYAESVFFLANGKYPDAFKCVYCNTLFGEAPDDLMQLQAHRSGLLFTARKNV